MINGEECYYNKKHNLVLRYTIISNKYYKPKVMRVSINLSWYVHKFSYIYWFDRVVTCKII